MADASASTKLRAFAVLQGGMWVAGVVRFFAGHVHRYNTGIDALGASWREAQAENFGEQLHPWNATRPVDGRRDTTFTTSSRQYHGRRPELVILERYELYRHTLIGICLVCRRVVILGWS